MPLRLKNGSSQKVLARLANVHPFRGMFNARALLVLGRVSNLSTVWSNCLCPWVIAGGGSAGVFVWLLIGLSLIYVGGMYLNDFCDVKFDQEFRPERPIPAGQIRRKTVLALVIALFLSGFASIAWIGWHAACHAVLLLGLIVAYNIVHKKTALGVPLMAACRASIYLTVGAAAIEDVNEAIYWASGLMFLYTFGVTSLARTESTEEANRLWGIAPLIATLAGAVYLASQSFGGVFLACLLIAGAWIGWAFLRARANGTLIVGKTIGPLLAGICLVDLLIISSLNQFSLTIGGSLMAFFGVALIAQRRIPAT